MHLSCVRFWRKLGFECRGIADVVHWHRLDTRFDAFTGTRMEVTAAFCFLEFLEIPESVAIECCNKRFIL